MVPVTLVVCACDGLLITPDHTRPATSISLFVYMISVVVPVYNVEQYLGECLESILASTYLDFELLLVDDGSTDGSGNMCDAVAASDERVRVIHQSNAGVAVSRNVALEAATGEYICFVDADDVVAPDMLQRLHDALSQRGEQCDFAMGRAVAFGDEEPLIPLQSASPVPSVNYYSQEQYMSYLFRGNQFGYPVVWAKLFKREFIGSERFKSIAAEDIEWLTRLCVGMRQAIVVEQPLYGYRVRSGSMTHDQDGVNDTIVERLDTFLMCLNDLPKHDTRYRSWCLLYTYKMMLNTRYRARKTTFAAGVNQRVASIFSQTVEELKNCQLPWMVKRALIMFYRLPWLYTVLYSAYAWYYEKRNG